MCASSSRSPGERCGSIFSWSLISWLLASFYDLTITPSLRTQRLPDRFGRMRTALPGRKGQRGRRNLIAAIAAGALAGRLGYKSAYIWGMTSTVAACAVFLTGQPALLGFLFLFSGIVGSLQTTAGQAYLMEASGRGRLGRASAGYFLGY